MTNKKVKDFVVETRGELGATLDEIEHRLTPKNLVNQLTSWVSRSYDRNPAKWLVGIAVALVGAVSAVLWAIFSNED
jgi:hypothetical protein